MTAVAERVVAECDRGQTVLNELDELVGSGYSPRETARNGTMSSELGRVGSETDELVGRACRVLFGLEDELGVATVYWHQIILWIADLADSAERVGNRPRPLIAN